MSRFTSNEDVALIGAWYSVRIDSIVGNDQESIVFWDRVRVEYRTTWQGETVMRNYLLQQRVMMLVREVRRYVRFVRHYFMNLPNGWDNERDYEEGRRDYEEDGPFHQRWRDDAVYDVMKLHFPLVYDPDLFVQPSNIPPPQVRGEI
ncbi:hypothetical protein MKX03_032379 [Papaver bracteatum]|nr:hypothetical protein MKX03_032379 [Papaver bracteatum]